MPGHDVIVVGASAGGIDPVRQLVAGLPAGFPAAVFVVVHLPPHGPSALPRILSRAGPLPVVHPRDGQLIRNGEIYVAPPDYHLLVKPGSIWLVRGPRENNYRPSIDVLFRTAARSYGPRVIGVVLSGVLDDGTAGLETIKQAGGLAVVQHPADALYPDMPKSAINNVAVDYVLPAAAMPELLTRLVGEPAPPLPPPAGLSGAAIRKADTAELDSGAVHDHRARPDPSTESVPPGPAGRDKPITII